MKRLLLFVVIAAVIGIGILVLQPSQKNTSQPQEIAVPQQKTPEIIPQPTEQTILAILPQILGSQFNSATATYTLVNLDAQGGWELIIGAIENTADLSTRPVAATIQVITLTDAQGAYERIGRMNYREWMRGVPEVKELRDVNGDGQQDIIVSLMYGGASSWAEGILEVRTAPQKIDWLQMQTKQGQVQNAIFLLATAANHWNSVEFKDINNDTKNELIEIFAQSLPFEENINCTVNVYTWNNVRFVYSEALSKQVLSQLNTKCEF